jgi:chemotaxis-related protein WspB
MLFLLFRLGNDRYALDAGQVAEVLPLTEWKAIPLAARGLAGLLNYRGLPVPVIDLCELILGRPCQKRLSTRQILVHYTDAHGGKRLLGLVAEGATDTLRCELSELVDSGVHGADAPYLGPVIMGKHGIIQQVDASTLLPASLRDLLFGQVVGHLG